MLLLQTKYIKGFDSMFFANELNDQIILMVSSNNIQ